MWREHLTVSQVASVSRVSLEPLKVCRVESSVLLFLFSEEGAEVQEGDLVCLNLKSGRPGIPTQVFLPIAHPGLFHCFPWLTIIRDIIFPSSPLLIYQCFNKWIEYYENRMERQHIFRLSIEWIQISSPGTFQKYVRFFTINTTI